MSTESSWLSWIKEKRPSFTGDMLFNEPLSRHTYYRIGGPATVFAVPRSRADLLLLGQAIREQGAPYTIFGGGCNILVADEGFNGIVISNLHLNREISVVGATQAVHRVRTGSSVALTVLLRSAVQSGWSGLEFLCGIPGTVGGAVAMNAGTHIGETADRILRVEALPFLEASCTPVIFEGDQLSFEYRSQKFLPENTLIWAAEWSVVPMPSSQIQRALDSTLMRRKTTQPLDFPSCGSVFRNPKESGLKAWEVITQLGLRGHRIGNAQVSVKHSNFIVNLGGAKASEVLALIELIQEKALKELGIQMVLEVKLLK